jgi:putative nucleotidyltransferase with HDIG domain
MYVHDFNCAWIEIPFFQKSILIKNDRMVEKVISHGIQEVYIDTIKGLDISEGVPEEEAEKEIDDSIKRAVLETERLPRFDAAPVKVADYKDGAPLKEELDRARLVRDQANRVVTEIMRDARLGKQVQMEEVDHVVHGMVDSVLNNKHALMALTRIKKKDEYTFLHSVSVCVLMISFCKTMGLDKITMNQVGVGALLHDVGKMKVPQDLLNRNDKLNDEEFELVKEHVVFGRKILEETRGIPAPSMAIAVQHHERWDGSGYPESLKGDEISTFGQMAAVVDVYDAITSNRVYHKRIEPADALKKIYEWKGRHFNVDIVQNYIKCIGIYPIGTLIRTESSYLGVITEQGEKDMLRPKVRLIFNIKKDTFINPKDIDLESPDHTDDKIVSSENPVKWKVNPMMYMDVFG